MKSTKGDKTLFISEERLESFRGAHLSTGSILDLLKHNKHVQLKVPMGVGKTQAIDNLISSKETFNTFSRVIYLAPTHKILNERELKLKKYYKKKDYIILKPRPRTLCGPLNSQWSIYEKNGLSLKGKEELCSICINKRTCNWRKPLTKKIKQKKIVLATEQNLIIDPLFLKKIENTSAANKSLFAFDEAKLANNLFHIKISKQQLRNFLDCLQILQRKAGRDTKIIQVWITQLKRLINSNHINLQKEFNFISGLQNFALELQNIGVSKFGSEFRYIAYELESFKSSKKHERWWAPYGVLVYIARPFIENHTLFLTANTPPSYLADRFGIDNIYSPFQEIKFYHSKTTIYNIKNGAGAKKYFKKNKSHILNFFARLIRQNIINDKKTFLVSKEIFKADVAAYLKKVLLSWGLEIEFPIDSISIAKIKTPSATVIPIIHFGEIGTNNLTDYECCYCVCSYNIPEQILSDAIQSTVPPSFKTKVKILLDSKRNREPVVESKFWYSKIARVAKDYHFVFEIDPVLQAVGRCRFITKPREVILFQSYDFNSEFKTIVEFKTIKEAEGYFKLPPLSYLNNKEWIDELHRKTSNGKSLRAAARELGISRSKASRILKKEREVSQKTSLNIYKRKSGTLRKTTGRPK